MNDRTEEETAAERDKQIKVLRNRSRHALGQLLEVAPAIDYVTKTFAELLVVANDMAKEPDELGERFLQICSDIELDPLDRACRVVEAWFGRRGGGEGGDLDMLMDCRMLAEEIPPPRDYTTDADAYHRDMDETTTVVMRSVVSLLRAVDKMCDNERGEQAHYALAALGEAVIL